MYPLKDEEKDVKPKRLGFKRASIILKLFGLNGVYTEKKKNKDETKNLRLKEILEPKIGKIKKTKVAKVKRTKSEIKYLPKKWGNNNLCEGNVKNPIGAKDECNPYIDDYGPGPLCFAAPPLIWCINNISYYNKDN